MVIGFVVLISAVIGVWSASRVKLEKKIPQLPSEMVLELNVGGAPERGQGVSKYLEELGLGTEELGVPDLVDAIDVAAKDRRVKGLSLILTSSGLEIANLQELHAAILRFKASGKPIRAYANSFGEGGSGLGLYYLAAPANEIWMQPVGVVAIPGMALQLPFARGLLEKVGVTPQFFQRKEYKTAMEHFTGYEMSAASREQMTELVKDLGDQFSSQIMADRKKVSTTLRGLIDQGLFTDAEALKVGLIDKIDYRDVFEKAQQSEPVPVEAYAADINTNRPGRHLSRFRQIALISIDGMIVSGESSGVSPYGVSETFATSGTIADTIMQAAMDHRIKAIVLRINSPGGTPSAAETIYRAIVRAKTEYKKPVIVSMGGVAASGGYWVAAPADKIYALDGTLTGSIGVVGGKFDASRLWDKLDINWEEVSYGTNGGMWSFNQPFSPSEQERFEASLDSTYAAFIKRVTDGRKLTSAQVEAIAKGHVWTGRQAKELGLVDQIGGLDKALDDLAVKLGAEGRRDLNIVRLPKRESPLQAVLDLLGAQASLPSFLPQGVMDQIAPLLVKTDGRLIYEPLAGSIK
jgi:protease-4